MSGIDLLDKEWNACVAAYTKYLESKKQLPLAHQAIKKLETLMVQYPTPHSGYLKDSLVEGWLAVSRGWEQLGDQWVDNIQASQSPLTLDVEWSSWIRARQAYLRALRVLKSAKRCHGLTTLRKHINVCALAVSVLYAMWRQIQLLEKAKHANKVNALLEKMRDVYTAYLHRQRHLTGANEHTFLVEALSYLVSAHRHYGTLLLMNETTETHHAQEMCRAYGMLDYFAREHSSALAKQCVHSSKKRKLED